MPVDRIDPTPLTKHARRITRRLGVHGLAVTSETVGHEIRVTWDADPKVFVHCQADTPIDQVEAGLREWIQRSMGRPK